MYLRRIAALVFVVLTVGLSVGAAEPSPDRLGGMTLRVRVTKVVPEQPALRVHWRRGGEGLGGAVTHGDFKAEDGSATIPVGEWTTPLPLETVVGRPRAWEFPTITVYPPGEAGSPDGTPSEVAVEFEFAEAGKVFKTFEEAAPKGSTVGFTFPGDALTDGGAANPDFTSRLQGISGHARTRREFVEDLFPEPASPRLFGIIGHLAFDADNRGLSLVPHFGHTAGHLRLAVGWDAALQCDRLFAVKDHHRVDLDAAAEQRSHRHHPRDHPVGGQHQRPLALEEEVEFGLRARADADGVEHGVFAVPTHRNRIECAAEQAAQRFRAHAQNPGST